MEQSEPFDDVEVAILLIGTVEEQLEGLRRLETGYRRQVFTYLRRHYPGLPAQALDECYREAICDLAFRLAAYRRDPAGASFDPDQPLLPLFKAIAYRRAADRCRRAEVQEKATRAVEAALRAGGGFAAREGPNLVERAEFRDVIREVVARLPPSPRAVWGAYIDYHFEHGDCPSDEQLKEYLSARTRKSWTLAAVKGGKRNGKDALREHLRSKGYDTDW